MAAVIVVVMIALTCAILAAPRMSNHPYQRRIPSRYTNSEFMTPEDREVLKDVRTSFIPTSSIVLPPTEEILSLVEKEHEELILGILDTKVKESENRDVFNFSVELGAVESTENIEKEEVESSTNATVVKEIESGKERKKRETNAANLTSSALIWRNNHGNQNLSGEHDL